MRGSLLRDEDRQPEMTVVRNEFERGENSPFQVLYKQSFAVAFHEHPYHHPTIGWKSDIEGVSTARLKEFYDVFYHPNNATAMLIGDFDEDRCARHAGQALRSDPRVAASGPGGLHRVEPPQEGERRFVVRRTGEVAWVALNWRTVAARHADTPALAVLGNVLGTGLTARLYQALVEPSLTLSVTVVPWQLKDPALFSVFAPVRPGVEPAVVEKTIRDEMAKVAADGVTEAELERGASPDRGGGDLRPRLDRPDRRLALRGDRCRGLGVVRGLPGGDRAGQDRRLEARGRPLLPGRRPDGRPLRAQGRGRVRARRPAPARRRLPFAEAVQTRRLANGALFMVLENHFNPTVALSGGLAGGAIFAPPDRRLVASVTAEELLKGSERRTKLEIAEELESCGASLSFSTDASDLVGVDIGGSALSRDSETLFDTLVEVLRQPVFPADELEKEKKRLVGAIRQAQDQTSHRAYEAASRRNLSRRSPFSAAHGRGAHRAGRIADARRAALLLRRAVRSGDPAVRRRGRRRGRPGPRRPRRSLRRLADGPGRRLPARARAAGRRPADTTVVMPDKASADVVLAQPADLVRTAPDFVACTLANSALGQSSLTSRLGVRVRDVEGLTYGIHSSFTAGKVPGPFTVSLTVKPESRDAAVASTLDEITRFRKKGITPRELAHEKSSRIGKFQVDLASNAGIADAIDALGLLRLRNPSTSTSIRRGSRRYARARQRSVPAQRQPAALHDRLGRLLLTAGKGLEVRVLP